MDMHCVIFKTSDFIGKKWTIPLVLELHKNKVRKRFSELKNRLKGITPKLLSMRLKELEKHGLVKKETYSNEFPIRCEYSLTDSGTAFIKVIESMKTWALDYKFKDEHCRKTGCKNCSC
jgi:DNA-binding HxlR family transcriptional regulator